VPLPVIARWVMGSISNGFSKFCSWKIAAACDGVTNCRFVGEAIALKVSDGPDWETETEAVPEAVMFAALRLIELAIT